MEWKVEEGGERDVKRRLVAIHYLLETLKELDKPESIGIMVLHVVILGPNHDPQQ